MKDYELAKELKDAGFPKSNGWIDNGHGFFVDDGELVYLVPTLSELIEACNPAQFDDFGLSTGYTDQWEVWASYHGEAIPEVDLKMTGDTPEEAVAKLWLIENEKEKTDQSR